MKPRLSFLNIWNMNFGFFGIQFSFGLQQSNMSAIYTYLGANAEDLAILWLAGPVTGLVVQPIIGSISDNTWSPRWGRRKPFFLIGAVLASVALIFMPFSSSIWMAAGLLWILDAANNIAMEPYRAFISDKLPEKQLSLGFLMQSFFTGLGITLANLTPAILVTFGILSLTDKMPNGIPVFTYWAFGIGAVASTVTVLYSVFTTPEIPPTQEDLDRIQREKAGGNVVKRTLTEIVEAIRDMPPALKRLIPVQFLTWYAMFGYWQYITLALSKSLYHTLDAASPDFARAQVLTGSLNGTYNIICFSVAFLLVPVASAIGARWLHFLAVSLGGLGLVFMPIMDESVLFIIPIGDGITITTIYLYTIGLGISWASMMATPYRLLASSVPPAKMGIYMGIFNMTIVIPMIIQIFTMQYFVYGLLGNNPINVIILSGVLLIAGGAMTLRVQDR